jgi:hypothetical protein
MDANMSRQIICSCENKRLLKSKSYRYLHNSYCMICLYVHVDGVRLCLWTAATNGPIVYPPHKHSVMILTEENWRTWRKTGPSATLSTTNPTWTDVGFCGERPVTNHLSHGTTFDDDDYHHHVCVVRCLWTATTNRSIVHPSGDIWAWRTMVECCRETKTTDLFTRAILPAETCSSKQEEWQKKLELSLVKYFYSYLHVIFYMP